MVLNLGGSGTATITQVPLSDINPTPSNAPYALHLVLSGWTSNSVILRQRFQQNGVIWSGLNVAIALTAFTGTGFATLTGNIVDSNGTSTTVLSAPLVTTVATEYPGHGLLPTPSTNPNVPPVAYVEFQLLLASSIDIYLTSFQLIVEAANFPSEPSYIQDSVDRQIDHTFHYYRESLLRQQKLSVLTGWDFGLNPWQFYAVATTNLANNAYVADQTIVVQQAYVASATANNVSTARGTLAQNYGFSVTAVTATNQFALIQYIDPTTIRAGWGKTFSSRVKLTATLQTTTLAVKMRLIWRISLPSAIAQTEPVATWSANGEPVYSAGWTLLIPKNDPVYVLKNGANTLNFEEFVIANIHKRQYDIRNRSLHYI